MASLHNAASNLYLEPISFITKAVVAVDSCVLKPALKFVNVLARYMNVYPSNSFLWNGGL